MFRPYLRDRDIEIWHDRLRGNLLRIVGKKHGISRERVRQISRECEREARNFLFNNKESRLARELLIGVTITVLPHAPCPKEPMPFDQTIPNLEWDQMWHEHYQWLWRVPVTFTIDD